MPDHVVQDKGSGYWWTGHGWSQWSGEALHLSYAAAVRLARRLMRETGIRGIWARHQP